MQVFSFFFYNGDKFVGCSSLVEPTNEIKQKHPTQMSLVVFWSWIINFFGLDMSFLLVVVPRNVKNFLFVCLCVLAWCVASECNFLFDKLVTNAGENVFDGGPGTMFLASRFEGWYNWRQCMLAKGVSKPSSPPPPKETAATFPEAVNLP